MPSLDVAGMRFYIQHGPELAESVILTQSPWFHQENEGLDLEFEGLLIHLTIWCVFMVYSVAAFSVYSKGSMRVGRRVEVKQTVSWESFLLITIRATETLWVFLLLNLSVPQC